MLETKNLSRELIPLIPSRNAGGVPEANYNKAVTEVSRVFNQKNRDREYMPGLPRPDELVIASNAPAAAQALLKAPRVMDGINPTEGRISEDGKIREVVYSGTGHSGTNLPSRRELIVDASLANNPTALRTALENFSQIKPPVPPLTLPRRPEL